MIIAIIRAGVSGAVMMKGLVSVGLTDITCFEKESSLSGILYEINEV